MKTVLLLGFMTLLLCGPAFADELPDYVLNKDYENCMAGDNANPQRAAYCNCVRDGMRGWAIGAYMEAATQAAANAGNQNAKAPGKIEELANQCIAKVMPR
jgi:hypothetical protein